MLHLSWLMLLFCFYLAIYGTDSGNCGPGTNMTRVMQNDDSTIITSPHFPYYYSPSLDCTWHFMAKSHLGSFAIHILQFDIQPEKDTLTLSLGDAITTEITTLTFSSWISNHVVVIVEEQTLWLDFNTDFAQSGRGFEIQVERIREEVPCKEAEVWCNTGNTCLGEVFICTDYPDCFNASLNCDLCDDIDFQCYSGVGCVDKAMECDGIKHCMDASDEWACYECSVEIRNLTDSNPIFLSSPNFNLGIPYPNNVECVWLFTESEFGSFVITILELSTEWWDYLGIGHGHNVTDESKGSDIRGWSYPTTIIVPYEKMWIMFSSNHAVGFRGILLEVARKPGTVECLPDQFKCTTGFGCLDQTLVCNVAVQCIDNSDENECEYCSNNSVTVTNDVIDYMSPFYPLYYPNDLDCYWKVTSDHTDGYLVITFNTISLHFGHDFLYIGVGNEITDSALILLLTGSAGPRIASVNESALWLRLTSNPWGQISIGVWLQIEWREDNVACTDNEILCSNGYGCLDQTNVCDGQNQCLHGSDEEGCNFCGIEDIYLTPSSQLNVTSPLFPTQYPLTIDCIWTLVTSAKGTIVVEFLVMDTGQNYDKLYIGAPNATIPFDVDELIEGPLVLRFTGFQAPRSVLLPLEKLQMVWDASLWSPYKQSGFVVRITWDIENSTCHKDDFVCPLNIGKMCLYAEQKCDGRHLCPTGLDEQFCGYCGPRNIFLEDIDIMNYTSLQFPIQYPPNLNCEWYIIADESMIVVLRIKSFKLESGFDYLLIGNGEVAGEEQTAELTSDDVKVRTVASIDSTMWMILHTDDTGHMAGFYLEIEKRPSIDINDLCIGSDFHCGSGVCVKYSAKCDGFTDCYVNNADEKRCANVHCPGSYLCELVPNLNISKCVTMFDVCDGETGCPGGDDETFCDEKRCPGECLCQYKAGRLTASCEQGWTIDTLDALARTSNSLALSRGNIGSLMPGMFKGLSNLYSLSLVSNGIDNLEKGCFDGLYNVTWMDISRNNMTVIRSNVFEDLPMLQELYLWSVPLTVIHTNAFIGAGRLHTLVLIRGHAEETSITVHEGGLQGLTNLHQLFVDDHHLCCHFENLDQCTTLEPQPPLFMCGSLMQNSVLRISMWVLGISALVGNAYVIAVRLREKTRSAIQAKQTLLVGNLAVSDCLMGVYMVILASVDVYYGDTYFIYSDAWRSSSLCKLESFLSLLSSEASIFFITLITLDRFLCIMFPLSFFKLETRSCKVVTLIIWLVAFVLALVPTLLAGPDSEFYDLSDVCIGLPLITRPTSYTIESSDVGGLDSSLTFDLPVPEEFKPAWFFSIFIFLGVNLVCFLFILICYAIMFINVKIMRRKMKGVAIGDRDTDLKLAVKMAAIVGTDFICWMPVIIMGILSQTGSAVIPLQMYTWSVVFILPINSSLNPYLYTIASLITDYRKKGDKSRSHASVSDMTTMKSIAMHAD